MYDQTEHCYLTLEGNIGAGKSTFLRVLKRFLPVSIIAEPCAAWQNVAGENFIERYYTDMQRWAYSFQTYVLLTHVLAQRAALSGSHAGWFIAERSLYSARYCFVQNLFELGHISTLEWNLYQEWFAALMALDSIRPQGFIYLKTDPERCFYRIQKRGRHEESGVTRQYLVQLYQKHEAWLVHKTHSILSDVPVLILDGDKEFEHDAHMQEEFADIIKNFILVSISKRQVTQKERVQLCN